MQQIARTCTVAAACVTGYGEDADQKRLPCGLRPGGDGRRTSPQPRRFMPDVEFIVDIGGQDMKCFQVRDGAVDNIYLNEACSSGCGSFLQTFANALGLWRGGVCQAGPVCRPARSIWVRRCTVFMNSSVKQAQKDGATTERYFCGPVRQRCEERAFIRSSAPSTPGRSGQEHRGAGRHLLERRRAPGL